MSRRLPTEDRSGGTRTGQRAPAIASSNTSPHIEPERSVLLPIILVHALAELGIAIPAFLDTLVASAPFRDEVLTSLESDICVEAHLGHGGISCAIKIGRLAWYHHPSDEIHLFCVELPATIMTATDLPIATVLGHDLLTDDRIVVRSLDQLNEALPGIGIRLRLVMPTVTCPL
ncbi:hypothetical protein [Sphingomonas sp. UYP23]